MIQRIYSILYRITANLFPDSYCYVSFLGKSYHISIGLKYRRFLAKHIIKKCGKEVNIERHSHFGRNIVLGDYSGIGSRCHVPNGVVIGSHVMMGPEVVFYVRNHLFSRLDVPMCQQGFGEVKPIVIEDDVWIGRRVIILPGVTIGRGSVIGAGAVVAKDIPPYSVVVGNPCKVVRNRINNGI